MSAILVTAFVVREADLVKLAGNVPVRTWLKNNGPKGAEYVFDRGFPKDAGSAPDDNPEISVCYLGLACYADPGEPVYLPGWLMNWEKKELPVLTAVSNWMDSLPGKPLAYSCWGRWLICEDCEE